jgi:hypothetical protein
MMFIAVLSTAKYLYEFSLLRNGEIMYEVQVYDEDFRKWHSVSLEMCTQKRHCGCADRGCGLENCDHFFDSTEDIEVAKERAKALEKSEFQVRIIKRTH